MIKQFYVYIMTNKNNRVLYTGITNDLKKRVYEHREKFVNGFTKKYNVSKLVYYEIFEDPENAILREKKIKAGSRQKKIDLINSMNKNGVICTENCEIATGCALAMTIHLGAKGFFVIANQVKQSQILETSYEIQNH